MRTALKALTICAVLGGVASSAPSVTSRGPANTGRLTPLILDKNEGDKRVWRPIGGEGL